MSVQLVIICIYASALLTTASMSCVNCYCGGLTCQHTTINCLDGNACDINCADVMSCLNATIICPENNSCNITCNEVGSCWGANIVSGLNNPLVIRCRDGSSCFKATVNATYASQFQIQDCPIFDSCMGMTIYCPPMESDIKMIKQCNVAGIVGTNAAPLHLYAINGWNDINLGSTNNRTGTMYCTPNYSTHCAIAKHEWKCDKSADLTCDFDHISYLPTTYIPTISTQTTMIPTTSTLTTSEFEMAIPIIINIWFSFEQINETNNNDTFNISYVISSIIIKIINHIDTNNCFEELNISDIIVNISGNTGIATVNINDVKCNQEKLIILTNVLNNSLETDLLDKSNKNSDKLILFTIATVTIKGTLITKPLSTMNTVLTSVDEINDFKQNDVRLISEILGIVGSVICCCVLIFCVVLIWKVKKDKQVTDMNKNVIEMDYMKGSTNIIKVNSFDEDDSSKEGLNKNNDNNNMEKITDEGGIEANIVYNMNGSDDVEVIEEDKTNGSETVDMYTTGKDTTNEDKREKLLIKIWLQKTVKLPQYYNEFITSGYESLSFIKCITNVRELISIGIEDVHHQNVIMKEISKLE